MLSIAGELENGMSRLAEQDEKHPDDSIHIGFPGRNGEPEITRPGATLPILRKTTERQTYRDGLGKLHSFVTSCEQRQFGDKAGEVNLIFSAEQLAGIRLQLREHSVDVEKLWHQQDLSVKTSSYSWFAWLLGVFMSLIGFTLWYQRVQAPLDQALANDSSGNGQAPA